MKQVRSILLTVALLTGLAVSVAGLIGFVLEAVGYEPGASQGESTRLAILVLMSLVPAACQAWGKAVTGSQTESLVLTLVEAFGEVWDPAFHLPLIGELGIWNLFADIIGTGTMGREHVGNVLALDGAVESDPHVVVLQIETI